MNGLIKIVHMNAALCRHAAIGYGQGHHHPIARPIAVVAAA